MGHVIMTVAVGVESVVNFCLKLDIALPSGKSHCQRTQQLIKRMTGEQKCRTCITTHELVGHARKFQWWGLCMIHYFGLLQPWTQEIKTSRLGDRRLKHNNDHQKMDLPQMVVKPHTKNRMDLINAKTWTI